MYSKLNINEIDAVSVKGTSGKVKNVGYELQPDNMRPNLWVLDDGESMTLHRQSQQEELYFVLKGNGRMQVDDDTFKISTGDIVIVSPDAWRQFTARESLEVFVVGAPNVKDDGILANEVPDNKL